jgi:hypothetical protein
LMTGFNDLLTRATVALDGLEALGDAKVPGVAKWAPRLRRHYWLVYPSLDLLAEASRHGDPVRVRHRIPLITCR